MAEAVTWSTLRTEAAARLRDAGVPSPDADARWLVAAAAPDVDGPVGERALAYFDAMLARRRSGEPLQYVLGSWGFRSLDLLVDRRVLIPRPETEVVAGVAIEELRALGGGTAVDLGTGSGAIALAIATEVPAASVWAVDRSSLALEVARANLAGIGRPGARVRIAEGDWFDALPAELRGQLQVVVANPPYVAEDDVLPAEVRDWEPHGALIAGPSGIEDLDRIVEEAPAWLDRPGALVVECAPHQTEVVASLAEAAGFDEVEVGLDLSARPRFVLCRLMGA
ncbi:MAG: peptide chain release factor N(5)-glutamine methyltransferase [Acidobacteria bacterium]|nr:peptide chain release factor N(5)-glutamine methyltransferase [Acidobacteriota bacterium]